MYSMGSGKIKSTDKDRLKKTFRSGETFDDKADEFFIDANNNSVHRIDGLEIDQYIEFIKKKYLIVKSWTLAFYRKLLQFYKDKIWPLAKLGFNKVGYLRGAIIGSTLLLITLIVVITSGSKGPHEVKGVVTEPSQANSNQSKVQPKTPNFPVLTPDTVDKEKALSFDSSRGVAAYQDFIRGVTVTVSQQPLTDLQAKDPAGELEKLAVQLQASTSFDTRLGRVYITTPTADQDPSQTAVFIANKLLIFIRTTGVSISPEGWTEYINSINV